MKTIKLSQGDPFSSSSIYLILAALVSRGLSFLTVLITIHFLSSSQMGEVYFLFLLFGIATQFGDGGLSITSFQNNVSTQEATVTRIFLAVLQAVAALVIGLIVNALIKQVSFEGLIAIATSFIVGALGFGKEITLRKAMLYGRLSAISVIQQFSVSITQIILLIFHFGYMAILVASLIGQAIRLVLLLSSAGKTVKVTSQKFHQLINLSILNRNVTLSNASHYWTLNIDKFFVQLILHQSGLALFTISQSTGRIIDMSINQPLKKLLIPLYASTGDIGRFNYFNKLEYRWTTLVTTFWALTLWCMPSSLWAVFPSAWDKMILPIQIFSLAGILSPFINISGTAMMSTGSSKIVKNYSFARFLALICLLTPSLLFLHLVGAALIDVFIDGVIVIPYIILKAPTSLKPLKIFKEVLPFAVVFVVCVAASHLELYLKINAWVVAISVMLTYIFCVLLWKGRILIDDLSVLLRSLRTPIDNFSQGSN